jgi:drug/metabolite transporter (DMT)-like permease
LRNASKHAKKDEDLSLYVCLLINPAERVKIAREQVSGRVELRRVHVSDVGIAIPVSTGITTIMGTLPLVGLWDQRLLPAFARLGPADWLAFALLALGSTVIATVLWNYGVARLPGAQAGIFLNLLPIVSILGGSLLLGEHISQSMLLSGIIIVAGVVVTQVPSFIALNGRGTPAYEEKREGYINP